MLIKLKNNLYRVLFFFFFLTLFCRECPAIPFTAGNNINSETKVYLPEIIVVLKDGSNIYCRIIEKRINEIYIETRLFGKLTIPLSEISEMKNLTKDLWFPNPTDTRLFFAPTARGIKQGKGYLQDIYVFMGSANYGIFDNLSIGGMFSLIPGIKIEQQVVGITPKLSYEILPNLNIAAGALYAFSSQTIGNFGLGYGLSTFGNSDSNVTFGAGYGILANNYNSSNASFVMLGGMYRVWEYLSLISENWGVFTKYMNVYIPTFGVRFFGDRLSADIGIAVPLYVYTFDFGNSYSPKPGVPNFIPNVPLIPYVDFVFSF